MRSSNLYNGNPLTGKTTSIYWNALRALSTPQWYHTYDPIWYGVIPGLCPAYSGIIRYHVITGLYQAYGGIVHMVLYDMTWYQGSIQPTVASYIWPYMIWRDTRVLSSLQWHHTYGLIWYDVIPGFYPAYSGIIHMALYDMTWYQGSIQPTVVSYVWPYMIWRDTRVLSSLQWYHTYGPIWYDMIPGFYPAYGGIIHMALYDMTWYQDSIQPTVASYI